MRPANQVNGHKERKITSEKVDSALDSNAMFDAIQMSGLEGLDENANRMDRMVVYATINSNGFTLEALLKQLTSCGLKYDPEHVRQSLKRLDLAFIIGRQKDRYDYKVPLFKAIHQPGAEELLRREIEKANDQLRA